MSHNFKTVFASKGNVQIPSVQKTSNGKKQPYNQRTFQPYHQRLREYRFYVNIGRGVNIGCDRCFYIMLLITVALLLITRFIKGCFKKEFTKG